MTDETGPQKKEERGDRPCHPQHLFGSTWPFRSETPPISKASQWRHEQAQCGNAQQDWTIQGSVCGLTNDIFPDGLLGQLQKFVGRFGLFTIFDSFGSFLKFTG